MTTIGTITNCRPGSGYVHQDESFTINGVFFSYIDYDGLPGFKRTNGMGGPVRPGACMRVLYYDHPPAGNRILRLESATAKDSIDHCK